jgi:glycosyltransferase involved in cell wall biosynthesis
MNHYLELNPIRETASDRTGAFELIKPENFIHLPVISVVMSVYNGKKYLRESIDSILNQSCKDFEFIIVNDGSNDGSLEIVFEYQASDRRIMIVNQSNIGLTRSLNRGIKLAAGQYIARQDADDISVPTRLEKQLNYIKNCPELAMVGCLSDVFTADGIVRKCRVLKLSSRGIKQYLASRNLFMHGAVMMRKSCLAKVGFYREFFRHSQDYDLWLRLSQYFDIDILPEHLYQYRVTPQAISVSQWLTQKQYADIARKLHAERLATGKDSYNTFVSSYPIGLPLRNDMANKHYYHIYIAKEFMTANKLNQARSELWKAWKLGCRSREIFYLFLKSLLGAGLLDTCRKIKNLKFKV